MRRLLRETHLRKPWPPRLHLLRVLHRHFWRPAATCANVSADADPDANANVRLLADQQMELSEGT